MPKIAYSIIYEGIVLNDAILKVDSFLNHQIDPELMVAIGKEFAARFGSEKIDKVFTIESSGIACALTTALCLHVPVVFARKQKSELMSSPAYTTKVYSFTKKVTSDVSVLKKFLHEGETVLIVDDFLAKPCLLLTTFWQTAKRRSALPILPIRQAAKLQALAL